MRQQENELAYIESNIRWNSFVSDSRKLVYIATPKVACTTIKWWFAALEGVTQRIISDGRSHETDPDLIVHDLFPVVAPGITGLPAAELARRLTAPDYFRFALVRNPYQRIFSAWQSKLLLWEPLQIKPYLKYDFIHGKVESAGDIAAAFEAFLEHLAEYESPNFVDVHWTPQSVLLRPDKITYSVLEKIENKETLREALVKHLGPSAPDPFSSHRSNASLIPYSSKFISKKSASLMKTLYASDFATFGYAVEPPVESHSAPSNALKTALSAIRLIRGRNQRLDEVRTRLAGDIADHQRKITERDALIAKQQQLRDDQTAKIAALTNSIETKDRNISELSHATTNLTHAIAQRDQRMAVLDSRVAELEVSLSGMKDELAKKAEEIFKLESSLIARERELVEANEQADKLNIAVDAYKREVVAKSDHISTLDKHIAAQKDALARQTAEIVTQSEHAGQLEETMSELSDRYKAKECEIYELKQSSVNQKNREQELVNQSKDLEVRLGLLNQLLENRRSRVLQLETSRSWRITRPLRWAAGIGRKLHWTAVRFRAIQREYGALAAFKKSVLFVSRRIHVGRSLPTISPTPQQDRNRPIDARENTPSTHAHRSGVIMLVDNFYDGGVERVVIDLCVFLRARGIPTMVLVAGSGGRSTEEALSHGIQVQEFNYHHEDFAASVKKLPKGLVLTHHCYFGLDVLKNNGLTVVEVIHNAYHWQRGNTHLSSIRGSHISAYISVSKFAQDFASNYLNISAGAIRRINNGLNTDGFIRPPLELLRERRLKTRSTPKLVHVANLHPQKNHRLVIQAYAKVRDAYTDSKLFIAGALDGYPELRSLLEADIKQFDLDDAVVFTGPLSRRALSRILAESHLALLPSQFEGFSIATLEFAYFGLPSILSRTGAAQELANSYGHILMPDGCAIAESDLAAETIMRRAQEPPADAVENLSAAMQQMLSGYPEWLDKAIAAAGRHEDYSIEHVTAEYATVITTLAAN